jgi:hypothetical protein
LGVSDGAIFEGRIRSLESWKYVARFAFNPTEVEQGGIGKLDFKIRYPTNSDLSLILYYDGFESWTRMLDSGKSCRERVRNAKALASENKAAYRPLAKKVASSTNTKYFDSNGRITPNEGNATHAETTDHVKFRTSRVRWFFVTFGTCDPDCTGQFCSTMLDVDYEFTFTNGDTARSKHYSANEVGMREAYITFLCLQTLLLICCGQISMSLQRIRKFHHTVKLLLLSVALQLASTCFSVAYWELYGATGYGVMNGNWRGLILTASILRTASEFGLLILFVLVAKGWTIVRPKISAQGRTKIAVYGMLYFW